MVKVAIDAGHGGNDPGAVSYGREEKEDVLRLAKAVGKLLEESGVEVFYTREDDTYDSPLEKAEAANAAEADFFVSLHRNSSPSLNQYSGVESLVYDKSGTKLEMAENINQELERAGFQNLGVKERTGLAVLRRTKMPAVLVEVGFINNWKDNELFDENFEQIAQGIAQGILKTLNLTEEDHEEETTKDTYYRVQTGAFRNREYAQQLLGQLQNQGYPAFIMKEGEWYLVQVGAFKNLENAVRMERNLRNRGYSTFITV